jgi:thioredoxin-related protein
MAKIMKKLLTSLVAVLLLSSLAASAAEREWLTDYSTALAKAKAEKKMLLMDFTGSDWCVWCIKLQKEVFSKKEFKEYAKSNLVLLEVDFPQHKKLAKAQEQANEALQEKYKIEGFPTIIVLDGEGKNLGQLGYSEGGPKPFIAELEKLKKK